MGNGDEIAEGTADCADSDAADMEESTDRVVAGEGDRQLAELSGRMGLPAVWY